MQDQTSYPVTLEVDYPESLDRLTTFFRIIMVLPVMIFLALLSGSSIDPSLGDYVFVSGSGVVLALMAVVFVRQYIPRWLFDFQVAVMRFANRAVAYALLLTDQFPAFEGDDYPVRFDVAYPEQLNRWKVLVWKLISSIPHFIILFFLALATIVVVVIAWFAILFTGRFPRGLHTFVVGVMRWENRVTAYVYSLTDEYPPFSLD